MPLRPAVALTRRVTRIATLLAAALVAAGGGLACAAPAAAGTGGAASGAATGAAAGAPAAAPTRAGTERLLRLEPSRPIAPFALQDQDGREFLSARQLPGQVSLVFFGFTHCPDVCPTTLLALQQVLADGPEFAAVRLYMISVDGERDTPAVLKAFLGQVSPRIVGLTGPAAQVRPVARSFTASFVRQPPTQPGGFYTVDHSSQVYLVGRDGRLRAIFFNAPPDVLRAALRDALR
jgi:protein SCO1